MKSKHICKFEKIKTISKVSFMSIIKLLEYKEEIICCLGCGKILGNTIIKGEK